MSKEGFQFRIIEIKKLYYHEVVEIFCTKVLKCTNVIIALHIIINLMVVFSNPKGWRQQDRFDCYQPDTNRKCHSMERNPEIFLSESLMHKATCTYFINKKRIEPYNRCNQCNS